MTSRFTRSTPIVPALPTSVDSPLSRDPIEENSIRVEIPEKMRFLFEPSRYKVAYGGRGGVKSWSFARALLLRGAQSCKRILCAREFQTSIKDSVHRLLCDQIKLMELDGYYQVFNTEIRGTTGTEIFFVGLRNNVNKVQSDEGIDICWVEEAEKVSNNSWQVLIPTIRKAGSEIWISFNPQEETDPTYKRFILNPPPGAVIVLTSWADNPWLPKELQDEKDYLARVDKDAYDHVWGGETVKKSNAQVMHGKCVLDVFVPGEDWDGPYYGADWGFASDPATLIKVWINGNRLYVEEEFWGIGVEINDLPDKFLTVSGSRDHVIRADNARPETISYLKNYKYQDGSGNWRTDKSFPRIVGAEKWSGSVEDGISFLRSFEVIVIHPRCVHTSEESRTYRHKVDALTGDILPEIIDKNNHCWDPIRYAVGPLIQKRGIPGVFFVGSKQRKEHQLEKQAGEIIAHQDHALHGNRDRDAAMRRWLRGD